MIYFSKKDTIEGSLSFMTSEVQEWDLISEGTPFYEFVEEHKHRRLA